MRAYWGVERQLHALLTSALDGGELSASRAGHFNPGTHWIGDYVSVIFGNKEGNIHLTALSQLMK
jgi:hypothetical protein